MSGKEIKPYNEITAEDVDTAESRLACNYLDEKTVEGIVQEGWVNTNIRSKDGIRYLYLNVQDCRAIDVEHYLMALDKGFINRGSLRRLSPKKSQIFDIMPEKAMPRLKLGD